MKPAAFKYIEAHDEGAVVAALSQYGGEARLLAGGQSLVPMMNFRVATPAVLIDLNAVVSLSYVRASLQRTYDWRHGPPLDGRGLTRCGGAVSTFTNAIAMSRIALYATVAQWAVASR